MSCRRLPCALLLLVCIAGAVWADNTHDVVIFRDGFTLEGRKVEQDREVIMEGHISLVIPKGTFALDDVARVYSFAVGQVADVVKKETLPIESFAIPRKYRFGQHGKGVNPVFLVQPVHPFNEKWYREVRLYGGSKLFRQRLMELNSKYAQVDALDWAWRSFYLTSEVGPELALRLIRSHPKMVKIGAGKGPADEELAIYHFLVEAGWYPEASTQLDAIAKKFPNQKSKVAELRHSLEALSATRMYDDLEIAYRAGQHERTQKLLASFPIHALEAGNKMLTSLGAMRAKYQDANDRLQRAQRLLRLLPDKVAKPGEKRFFKTVTKFILEEISLDDFLPDATPGKLRIGRLEPFLGLADQFEREQRLKQTPTATPDQILSLAVTGWLLGRDAADKHIATARRLWTTREFVLTYLNTRDESVRRDQIEKYAGQRTQYASPDEVAQMLQLLPPVSPEPSPPATATELTSRVTSEARHELHYAILLPPEYRPSRSYPLLIALHNAGEKPADMLVRCGAWARKYGFIVAAPAWERLLDNTYGYTPEEHAAVTDLLVDVRRRFQVDSNRVFVMGFCEGGSMAYDVGLAHPDLFAGVVVIAGQPLKFASAYWPNAQYLPFYVVDGENSGRLTALNLKQFKHWVHRGYPAIHAIYRGRGIEWFGGEMPNIFRWMALQHRTTAGAKTTPRLGDGDNAFQTSRAGDNHFYWISTDTLDARRIMPDGRWESRRSPATLYGHIVSNNEVILNTRGIRSLSVWLGRDLMIDFERPIKVYVNGALRFQGKVQPKLETLLEDYYRRADRQRVFVGRVTVSNAER